MKIYIQSVSCSNLVQSIQLLRQFTGESISTVKNNLTQKLPLTTFDTLDGPDSGRERFLQLINDLEKSGCKLAFFDAEDPAVELDRQFFQNKLDQSDEISAQIERQNELWGTEIIAATTDYLEGELLFQKDEIYHYRFDYSSELIDFIKQENQAATYYRRDRDDSDKASWEEISVHEILNLMGL